MNPPAPFQNYLLTALFFVAFLAVQAQREAPKAANVKSGATTSSSSSYNSKGTPATIKDSYGIWTDFDLRSKPDADALKAQIGYTLFEEIANNCNETLGWPGAIASYTERNKVRDQMLKYVCYQIGEIDDKWILRVPASENGFLPYGVRPEHDIFFMVRKTDVDLTGSPVNTRSSSTVNISNNATTSSSSGLSKSTPAKINSTGGMYSSFNLTNDADASNLRASLGESLFDEIAIYCKENTWPSGITSLSARDLVRTKMNDYKAYKIADFDGKYILRIPASENKFMPYNMQPSHDIYFVINHADVTIGQSSSGSSSSYNAEPVKTTSSSNSYSSNPIGFEAQINALLEGLPDNFEHLKGDKVPTKPNDIMPSEEWYSTVKLEGSEKTIIRKQWLGKQQSMQAYFGEFKTKSEALDKFNSLVKKVDESKTTCCTLVKSENDNETIKSTAYLPFDLMGKMGPGYKDMVLDVTITKTFDFDKDYKMLDRWSVSVAIYKQK